MTTTTRFVALYHGAPIGTYDSRDAAAGACQDAALEANADEDEAREYEVVETGSTSVVVVSPELSRDSMSDEEYAAECQRLEDCYTALEADTRYSVQVRPARAGEAPGTYYRTASGNLQILGYSLEMPENLQELSDAAWQKFCA